MGENLDRSPITKQVFPSPLPNVVLYPLTAGAVLFVPRSARIWHLNATSAYIWSLLNEVDGPEEMASRLAAAFSIDMETASRDVETALTSFEREGLLADGWDVEVVGYDETWDITPKGPPLVEPRGWAVVRFFRVAGHIFEFRSSDASLGHIFAGQMSHFEVKSDRPAQTRLAILPSKSKHRTWDIYLDGLGFQEAVASNMVLPHLAMVVFVRCCQALHERLLFHAAVLAKGQKAMLLPGEAGSGKTTLAAILMAHGYHVLSDELAVLDVDRLRVCPLPLPMSIKSPSVKLLGRYYPELANDRAHLRTDGKWVRYIAPSRPEDTQAADGSAKPAVLVFPKHNKAAENRLAQIDEMQALQRLATTGSSNRDLTRRDVEAMISLVSANPCYELVFADASHAVALLQEQVLAPCLGQ